MYSGDPGGDAHYAAAHGTNDPSNARPMHPGADDLFSSDFSEAELRERLGHLVDTDASVLFVLSMADQYVPLLTSGKSWGSSARTGKDGVRSGSQSRFRGWLVMMPAHRKSAATILVAEPSRRKSQAWLLACGPCQNSCPGSGNLFSAVNTRARRVGGPRVA
jgi:hypothetical protein